MVHNFTKPQPISKTNVTLSGKYRLTRGVIVMVKGYGCYTNGRRFDSRFANVLFFSGSAQVLPLGVSVVRIRVRLA